MDGIARKQFGADDVSPYAAPARASSLVGLPLTYIDVGGFAIYRDEDLNYAFRLLAAGVMVEFYLYPRLLHVFVPLTRDTHVVRRAFVHRFNAIKND